MEKEVDVRKRVSGVFNKREEEFETLRDWNDYLNKVEDITFNLLNGVDLEETEKEFEVYRLAHEREILENASLEERDRIEFSQQKRAELAAARERREAARKEDDAERREVQTNRRDVLDRLAAGNEDAEKVAKEGVQVQLKKRMDRQAAAERQRQLQMQSSLDSRNGSSNLIRGLKAKTRPAEPEEPVDPFGGLSRESKYYALQDEYIWAGVQETKADLLVTAGGYDVRSFTGRALCEAFAGLGVFIGEEKLDAGEMNVDQAKAGTARAELAAQTGTVN